MSPDTPLPDPSRTMPAQASATSLLTLARLASRDDPPLNLYLAAVDALVAWQRNPPATVAPAADAAVLHQQLDGFTTGYLQGYRQYELDAGQRKTLDTALATIVDHYRALPTTPVHGGFAPDQLVLTAHQPRAIFAAAAPSAITLGPVGCDIGCLTRDAQLLWDEAFTLDVAIRYWELARKAGLPVDADFGEFYRGLEWAALMRHLTLLGERAQAASGTEPQDGRALMALVLATCNRYIELKPLLRLLERIEGLDVQGGFVFGRI